MSTKGNIKVIKRADAPPKRKKKPAKTSRAKARDMVSTVTGWVAEVKERKTEETRAALDLLFNDRHRPNEA